MSKVSHKKDTVALTVATNQVLATFDITNCNGVAIQLNGIVGTVGSMKVQHSNDNTNWMDITSATLTLTASAANIINIVQLYTGHVRVLVTLSAGAGDYDYFFLGKEN